ncbi:hypothetical protein Aab01nite_09370 [Paractinoplanes abujensis]|nr:hypothetical protein Aab01nite_09370 [Actinoplanes abujensis]
MAASSLSAPLGVPRPADFRIYRLKCLAFVAHGQVSRQSTGGHVMRYFLIVLIVLLILGGIFLPMRARKLGRDLRRGSNKH